MHKLLTIALAMNTLLVPAQRLDSVLTLSAYAEVYYGFDLSRPDDHVRPAFIYNHNRHNEVNLNLGMLKAAYASPTVRGNMALMAGTYSQANMAAEPALLRSVYEANVGVKLGKRHALWLDAGILPSHIGHESAIGKDCWTLSRSLNAESTPYYEAGIRVSYTSANTKWNASGLLLNGWQRITRPEGNNTPAFGTQLTYSPNPRTTLNWSTFVGSDKPDSASQLRVFNNLYAKLQLSSRWGVIAGVDIGLEEDLIGTANLWVNPTLIARYRCGERSYLAARLEYFQDEENVIITVRGPYGFNSLGYSVNFDQWITPRVLWRLEAKQYSSMDALYVDARGNASGTNTCFTASLCLGLP